MASSDDRHSIIVGWLKLLLPLIALALLSTLFLFSRRPPAETEIPFARIEEIARDQQIVRPAFSGVTDNGQIVTMTAAAIRAMDETANSIAVERPELTLDAGDGRVLTITAGMGRVDLSDRNALLSGLARLETSTGYTMESEGISADLQSGRVRSAGALAVRTPFGDLRAGQVDIETGRDGSGQEMRFTDGVKLIYRPADQNGESESRIE